MCCNAREVVFVALDGVCAQLTLFVDILIYAFEALFVATGARYIDCECLLL